MSRPSAVELAPGLRYYPDYLDRPRQDALLRDLGKLLQDAPLFQPTMPKSGAPFSVRMTNCGAMGWISDRNGYRYSDLHPVTGRPWPPMPALVRETWAELADYPRQPEACLVNYYAAATKMGLHQDKDEEGFAAPVVARWRGARGRVRVGGRGPPGAAGHHPPPPGGAGAAHQSTGLRPCRVRRGPYSVQSQC